MRRFYLERQEDESGVSGIGKVAEGVEFENARCVVQWLSHKPTITIFDNIKHLKDLHGHGGKTVVVWVDPKPVDDERLEDDKEVSNTQDN